MRKVLWSTTPCFVQPRASLSFDNLPRMQTGRTAPAIERTRQLWLGSGHGLRRFCVAAYTCGAAQGGVLISKYAEPHCAVLRALVTAARCHASWFLGSIATAVIGPPFTRVYWRVVYGSIGVRIQLVRIVFKSC
ncbi:hypothetical protein C8Q80DRAFT_437380 [Daedaleopsis nitida]|nr:hypothetical protein C8Q80DRAFT_437380 [Daedaleopsis nitida]